MYLPSDYLAQSSVVCNVLYSVQRTYLTIKPSSTVFVVLRCLIFTLDCLEGDTLRPALASASVAREVPREPSDSVYLQAIASSCARCQVPVNNVTDDRRRQRGFTKMASGATSSHFGISGENADAPPKEELFNSFYHEVRYI